MNAGRALLEKEKATRELCAGHYKIEKLKEEINKLYQNAHEQEKEFTKKLKKLKVKKRRLTQGHAQKVARVVCNLLGIRVPKIYCKVINEKEDVAVSASAWYVPNKIKTRSIEIGLLSLVHELGHHLQAYGGFRSDGHGKGFLEAESFVFETLEYAIKKRLC